MFPVAILAAIELCVRRRPDDAGWKRLETHYKDESELLTESQKARNREAGAMYSNLAFTIMTGTYGAIGIIMLGLALLNDDRSMYLYGGIFAGVATVAYLIFRTLRPAKGRSTR